MSHRVRLPNRRAHELIDFVQVGPATRTDALRKYFSMPSKAGMHVKGVVRDGARSRLPFCFGNGGPVETLRHHVPRTAEGSTPRPLAAVLHILASEA
jgi:hypothetical protein